MYIKKIVEKNIGPIKSPLNCINHKNMTLLSIAIQKILVFPKAIKKPMKIC